MPHEIVYNFLVGREDQENRGEQQMGALAFRCPQTNQTVATGITIDSDGVGRLRSLLLRSRCPCCEQVHELPISDAFLLPMMRSSEAARTSAA